MTRREEAGQAGRNQHNQSSTSSKSRRVIRKLDSHPPTMPMLRSVLLALAAAVVPGIHAQSQEYVTTLSGTWSSGSQAVSTGLVRSVFSLRPCFNF